MGAALHRAAEQQVDVFSVLLSDPSTRGAGGKTRLEPQSIKTFKPHLIYDSVDVSVVVHAGADGC